MKQSVNLYLPEFRKKKDWLNAARMAQLVLATVVVVLLVSAFEFMRASSAEQAWAEADQRRAAAVAATEALRTNYGSQSRDESVADQIVSLEEDLKSKQAILSFMRGRDMGNTGGFSAYMTDLARFHMQGLSLRNISLLDGGKSVTLEGDVMRAELVPNYLQNLSKGETFKGMSFHTLKIGEASLPASGVESEGNQVWHFAVSTVRP